MAKRAQIFRDRQMYMYFPDSVWKKYGIETEYVQRVKYFSWEKNISIGFGWQNGAKTKTDEKFLYIFNVSMTASRQPKILRRISKPFKFVTKRQIIHCYFSRSYLLYLSTPWTPQAAEWYKCYNWTSGVTDPTSGDSGNLSEQTHRILKSSCRLYLPTNLKPID